MRIAMRECHGNVGEVELTHSWRVLGNFCKEMAAEIKLGLSQA
jgi:hypothetical protein